ncbi:MAG TPA: hypothetical protein VKE24_00970 [Candidatus Acidoferrales bacterium]|nr:hypothetical protein [Candidatus Acidoferrales bacterium]
MQFISLATETQRVTVVAREHAALAPDPSERILLFEDLLEGNPGRPGGLISIPGLPMETASGGIKAPQYFAPGVAGDHGEPIAQFLQVGEYLFPNNLPANAHGNGYADPNFLISRAVGTVETDGGAFNIREGNHAVNLAVAYGLRPRLEPLVQLTADSRDTDLVVGWGPANPTTRGWVALEGSYGNGFLGRLERRKQWKLNGYRVFRLGRHELAQFSSGYYGFSRIPGLIPIEGSVPNGTVDSRQLDRTHTTLFVVTDKWQPTEAQEFEFNGFFRTYQLTLRSNFGDGLIQQSEFRTIAGGNTTYVYRVRPELSLLAGLDLRRDAPRDLDLKRVDATGVFQPVTSNDLTLGFVAPFVSIDGALSRYFHYDLGMRREEVRVDNLDRINPSGSFHRLAGITLPKGTLTVYPPRKTLLPSVALSSGEAFHSNDPRIGQGGRAGTLLAPSHAYQLVLKKDLKGMDLRVTLARVAKAQELGKIDPDTGLPGNVGPSLVRSITLSARRCFSFGYLQASWARADARNGMTGEAIPEAPRLVWDVLGSIDRLPLRLHARGEYESVGPKPLGGAFVSLPVREFRGALLRSFGGGRMDVGINFLIASGFTGQTVETLQLPGEPGASDRIVGIPLGSYVSVTWTYKFRRESSRRTK